MCQVCFVFDLAVREVVGMTGADFSHSRSIPNSILVWKRLWARLELIYDVPGHSTFDLAVGEVEGMMGADFSHSRSIPHSMWYLISLWGWLWLILDVICHVPVPFGV